jgi:hypothetical protein
MGNCYVKANCNLQLWLITHSNCITKILLHILYSIDVLLYSIGPRAFLLRRRDIFGPNFASLGRIIIGEYDIVASIINSPQKRGPFLGRAKLYPSGLPQNFPLLLSDKDAGGGDTHATLHQYVWESLIPPAMIRLDDPAFDRYLQDCVGKLMSGGGNLGVKETRVIVRQTTIQYIFHAILGLPLSQAQISDVYTLFFSQSPTSDYVLGILKPWSFAFHHFPCCCLQNTRTKLISSLTQFIVDSPALANYVQSQDNANLTKQEYAEVLLAVSGIAGCLGTSNLLLNVLNEIPKDYDIDLDSKMEVTLAVLEAARIRAPVNNVNVILQNKLQLDINSKGHTFPPGTVVAASIGTASNDLAKFKDPHKFNPKREHLMSANLNFNHVGFNPVGAGTRQCPGRNIAVRAASQLLKISRSEYVPPVSSE